MHCDWTNKIRFYDSTRSVIVAEYPKYGNSDSKGLVFVPYTKPTILIPTISLNKHNTTHPITKYAHSGTWCK